MVFCLEHPFKGNFQTTEMENITIYRWLWIALSVWERERKKEKEEKEREWEGENLAEAS